MRIVSYALLMAMLALMFLPPVEGKVKFSKGTSVQFVNAALSKIGLVLWRPGEGVRQVTTYTVSPGAVITLDGSPVKLGRIRKGMHVNGYTEGNAGVLDKLDVQN